MRFLGKCLASKCLPWWFVFCVLEICAKTEGFVMGANVLIIVTGSPLYFGPRGPTFNFN